MCDGGEEGNAYLYAYHNEPSLHIYTSIGRFFAWNEGIQKCLDLMNLFRYWREFCIISWLNYI